MSDTKALTRTEQRPPERRRPFKNIAITLWGIALLCAAVRTAYAENVRVLALTGGLIVIIVGVALLLTLLAYLEAIRAEDRVLADYSYRWGWRDCETRRTGPPTLTVVEPVQMRYTSGAQSVHGDQPSHRAN
jgi:hypothetical protein